MKKLEVNQMENLEGGKFWGTVTTNYGCYGGHYYVQDTYYVFWMTSGPGEPYDSGIPCNG